MLRPRERTNGAEPFPEEGGEAMRVGMEESGLGSSEMEGS